MSRLAILYRGHVYRKAAEGGDDDEARAVHYMIQLIGGAASTLKRAIEPEVARVTRPPYKTMMATFMREYSDAIVNLVNAYKEAQKARK